MSTSEYNSPLVNNINIFILFPYHPQIFIIYLLSLSKYTSYTFFVSCRYYIFMEKISLTPFCCFGFKNNWWSCIIFFLVYHAYPSAQDYFHVKLSHSIVFYCRGYVDTKNHNRWVLRRERVHTIIHASLCLYIQSVIFFVLQLFFKLFHFE